MDIGSAARSNGNATAYDGVIRAPNPDRLLELGMSAVVEIVVERCDNILRVPTEALRFSVNGFEPRAGVAQPEDSPQLWVLREGKPAAIAVELGLGDSNYTEIVKGAVQPGNALIIGEDGAAARR